MELKPLLIENARLLGGETGRLLAVDARIAALNPAEAPEGAARIDAKGQWLAPGIIDLGAFPTAQPPFHFAGLHRPAPMPDGAPLANPGLVDQAAKGGTPALWVHPLAAPTNGRAGHRPDHRRP